LLSEKTHLGMEEGGIEILPMRHRLEILIVEMHRGICL
jgi:hypothetical protein